MRVKTAGLVVVFLAAIVAANLTLTHFGPDWIVINAFLLIGLDFITRDRLADVWGTTRFAKMSAAAMACGVCGAPWRRVVERTAMVVTPGLSREARQDASVGARKRLATNGTMTQAPMSVTTGWEPSCAHDDDTGRSVVLDPFCGSGTVGVVSRWYGRDFIGIELNKDYAEMARRRIETDGALGRRARRERPGDGLQLDLLS